MAVPKVNGNSLEMDTEASQIGALNSRKWLTRFTLEFSFPVSKAGAAHHLAILPLPVPLLPNLVVHTVIVAPLWRRQRNISRSYPRCCGNTAGEQLDVSGTNRGARERIPSALMGPEDKIASDSHTFSLQQLVIGEVSDVWEMGRAS